MHAHAQNLPLAILNIILDPDSEMYTVRGHITNQSTGMKLTENFNKISLDWSGIDKFNVKTFLTELDKACDAVDMTPKYRIKLLTQTGGLKASTGNHKQTREGIIRLLDQKSFIANWKQVEALDETHKEDWALAYLRIKKKIAEEYRLVVNETAIKEGLLKVLQESLDLSDDCTGKAGDLNAHTACVDDALKKANKFMRNSASSFVNVPSYIWQAFLETLRGKGPMGKQYALNLERRVQSIVQYGRSSLLKYGDNCGANMSDNEVRSIQFNGEAHVPVEVYNGVVRGLHKDGQQNLIDWVQVVRDTSAGDDDGGYSSSIGDNKKRNKSFKKMLQSHNAVNPKVAGNVVLNARTSPPCETCGVYCSVDGRGICNTVDKLGNFSASHFLNIKPVVDRTARPWNVKANWLNSLKKFAFPKLKINPSDFNKHLVSIDTVLKSMEDRYYSEQKIHSKKAMTAVKTGKTKDQRAARKVAIKPEEQLNALAEQVSLLAKSVTTLVEDNDDFKSSFFASSKASTEDVGADSESSDE